MSLTQPHPQHPFQFPREHSFPPFFTRQPNLTTHHAQLTKWTSLILAYCTHHRIFRLPLTSSPPTLSTSLSLTTTSTSTPTTLPPLFANDKIHRRLSDADIKELFSHMKKEGRADWVAGTGEGVAWVYWRTPEEWAGVVERWVEETGQRGQVLTVYELLEGEKTVGTDFHGMDSEVLMKALNVLVKRCKAQIFGQDASGVKFF